MDILLSGATGLIGRALSLRLAQRGHRVVPLRRTQMPVADAPCWLPTTGQIHLASSISYDAVIHLAGETIAQRWTTAAKQRIRASRVDGTRLLSETLIGLDKRPHVLLCASATGFYGNRFDEVLDEQSRPGSGFLASTCAAWEGAVEPARQNNIRVVSLRFGIVLARNGGALAKMLPGFRFGLGGRLGHGDQYWSWIALEDVLRAVEVALQDESMTGPVNLVAPEAVTNRAFTAALGRAVGRPAVLPIPAIAIAALFGEMGREVLLASARVRPERLMHAGFEFQCPDLEAALRRFVR